MNTGLLLHTLLGLLLLLIPAGALYVLERKKLQSFVVAVSRMVTQLLVLCLIVWGLIKVDNIWLSLAWLLLMSGISAFIVLKRCKLDIRKLILPTCAGLFMGVFLIGLWLLGLVLPVRIFNPRWFVPVMALLLGHATSMMIRGLSTYVSALHTDQQQYEFLRGNGLTHFKALLPFFRQSLLAILSPTIANLTTLGLTTMPLLLCGLFLGGMTPINAFFAMLHMTVGCIAVSVVALAITLFLADKALFGK
jgi:putative ABC transport system permease protein